MNKSYLRKIYLGKQKNLAPSEREKKSREIAERFFAEFNLRDCKYLHCFLPIEKFNEIETKFILKKIWQDFPHIQTLAPRVNFQTSEMETLKFAPETVTTANIWQIHEPAHDEFVEAEKIDLVLVPLLCFDKNGYRVGYGKGFYDKFLKTCRADCLKIGLSYFEPVEEISDADEFDVKPDFFITPGNGGQ